MVTALIISTMALAVFGVLLIASIWDDIVRIWNDDDE